MPTYHCRVYHRLTHTHTPTPMRCTHTADTAAHATSTSDTAAVIHTMLHLSSTSPDSTRFFTHQHFKNSSLSHVPHTRVSSACLQHMTPALMGGRRLDSEPEPFEGEVSEDEFEIGEFEVRNHGVC